MCVFLCLVHHKVTILCINYFTIFSLLLPCPQVPYRSIRYDYIQIPPSPCIVTGMLDVENKTRPLFLSGMPCSIR